jgi:branched-chain amino acid transport system substrate-binding protein
VNEDGGLLGREVDFIVEDDQYAAEKASVNYTKLVQDDKVLTIANMGGSHISTQLATNVIDDGVAVVGLPQTIDAQLEGTSFFNNIAHYGDEADGAWVQIVSDLGDPASAIVGGISLEVPSGQEWAAYMEQTVENGGGTYIDTVYIAPTATEATAQVAQLKEWIDNEGVNYLSLHGSPGSALVVLQSLADAGIVIPTIGIHGLAANSLWEQGPAEQTDVTLGMHSFLPANNDIEASDEMTRCAELAGYAGDELTINFAHGFAVGMIIEGAILESAKSGELTRASFAEALTSQVWDTQGITCPVDWTSNQHSPCVAPFTYDPESGGMVPVNPFDFYAESLDQEYGIAG